MPKLNKTLHAWNSEHFSQTLRDELNQAGTAVLPLHLGTSQGGMVDDSQVSVNLISATEAAHYIQVKIGVFFNEIVGGCSCGDAPAATNAYCEMWVILDKSTAEAEINII